MSFQILHFFSIAMGVVLLFTQSFKKSYTTTLFISALIIAIPFAWDNKDLIAWSILLGAAILALLRAVLLKRVDRLLK